MPRLGDDSNMATAYPDRVNLRGTWMRQLLYTMVCTLVLYKVVFTDYKSATKESMAKKGLSEEAQERILPKTAAEKQREMKLAKLAQTQKAKSVQTLTYDLGNLTNAVMELQKLAADHYGVTLEYPVTLGDKEEGAEDADAEGDKTQPVDAGGGEGGDAPTGNLRGAGADGGNPEGSGGGDGDGGDGDAVDTGGDHARRLFTREKGEPEGRTGPAAAAVAGDEPAALRGGSGGPRQLEGGPRREG